VSERPRMYVASLVGKSRDHVVLADLAADGTIPSSRTADVKPEEQHP
jgi:hypothetical protein